MPIPTRWIKATLFLTLCFTFLKFFMDILLTPPKLANCAQYMNMRDNSGVVIPHFECEIRKSNPEPGILNILHYLKPHWNAEKVIYKKTVLKPH